MIIMSKNPNWTRDELIIALDLYFRLDRKTGELNSEEILNVSNLLNSLEIHEQNLRNLDFRNQHGVRMKLANFMAVDSEHNASGLSRGSKLDKEIFDEFSRDISKLRETALAIERGNRFLKKVRPIPEEVDDEEFLEGKILTKTHKYRERNSKAVKQKKKSVLEKEKKLVCEICCFDFADFYGNTLGYGFAECHHIIPLSQLTENHKTRIEDLAIVCANCHRMIHKTKLTLGIEELKSIIKSKGK